MNQSDIEYVDVGWGPVTGCLHDCPYCFARDRVKRFQGHEDSDGKITVDAPGEINWLTEPLTTASKHGAKRRNAPFPYGFTPTFYGYKLSEPLRKIRSRTVFVCPLGDLFGSWVPEKWWQEVINVCYAVPQHRYLFLTKYPKRYADVVEYMESGVSDILSDSMDPPEIWLGATATNDRQLANAYESKATWLSIEPLLEPLEFSEMAACGNRYTGNEEPRWLWIVIGAETGSRKEKVIPKKSWIDDIVAAADAFKIPVFMKKSLLPIMGEENMRRELPWSGAKKSRKQQNNP
jgi:protein gp37